MDNEINQRAISGQEVVLLSLCGFPGMEFLYVDKPEIFSMCLLGT